MHSIRTTTASLLLLPATISAVTFDCSHVRAGGQSFDLSALEGPKAVHWQQWEPPSISNTTFTIDLCAPLKKDSTLPNEEQCSGGTRVCAVEETFNTVEHSRQVLKVVNVAGDYMASHGRPLEPDVTRLKDSESSSDSESEGLRVVLHGGKYPDTRQGVEQRAIVELVCDKDMSGLEGFEDEKARLLRRKEGDDEDNGPELPDLDKGKALQFKSYKTENVGGDDVGTVRLTWKTRHACEDAVNEPDPDKPKKSSSGWGFFTWFIIVLFLLAAAYIIFGSWLNYNRYGARGWDLIPHGDTIRDVPYIVKEWCGDMVERMRGGGSRGGYSAV